MDSRVLAVAGPTGSWTLPTRVAGGGGAAGRLAGIGEPKPYRFRTRNPGGGSMSHTHKLMGCRPEPLGSYLKGLGVLRLIGQQVDANATAYWSDTGFVLQS